MGDATNTAFIIMQIGDPKLDAIYGEVFAPAAKDCGLEPVRVDRHNEGGLLKSEIIRFIEKSQIIIADITNERPNCYLEIGYAMGVGKFRNLILTVREDHFPDNENHRRGGPKVHFDLGGYDILGWADEEKDAFRRSLVQRIKRRLAIVSETPSLEPSPSDQSWAYEHRTKARSRLKESGHPGFMEVDFELPPPKPAFSLKNLNEAAKSSTIDTFGWPIAVYMGNHPEYRPRPRPDGIVAEIAVDDRSSYDYWTISKRGDFYTLLSLFEDRQAENRIFFDTAIVRTTEALLYCQRLYSRLGVDPTSRVSIRIRFDGLKGRMLAAANRGRILRTAMISDSDSANAEIGASLQDLESDIVNYVVKLLAPLFELFDFFELDQSVYEDIVTKFINGKC